MFTQVPPFWILHGAFKSYEIGVLLSWISQGYHVHGGGVHLSLKDATVRHLVRMQLVPGTFDNQISLGTIGLGTEHSDGEDAHRKPDSQPEADFLSLHVPIQRSFPPPFEGVGRPPPRPSPATFPRCKLISDAQLQRYNHL